MVSKATNNSLQAANVKQVKGTSRRAPKKGSRVTQARSKAQRAKLDKVTEARHTQEEQAALLETRPNKKIARQEMQTKRRVIATLIEAYLQDHIGGNSSEKTLEWHRTALGLMQIFLKEEMDIIQIEEVEADDISAWFAHLRSTPAARGKVRSERTVQTYARSARAFFHWLVRRGTLEHNPFDHVVFPKVGRPLIQTITTEEFENLLLACAPPNETGPFAERATVRNRAILWLLYDTGIRVSELINLRVRDVDRKHGVITVLGKGAKERRVALGQNCLRNLSYYLDKHRPDEGELAEWGSVGEDHLFLSETRQPLTKNGMEMLFKRLKKRAGITGKRISPHILRHTFAMNYERWLYLAVVLDLFSRRVIGWAMAATQDETLIETALRMALLARRPTAALVFHSDRGSQYTSDAYRAVLAQASISVSMSRTGNCYDNAVTESFFGTLKGECVERACCQTRREARQTIFEYVECFYNRVRRHSSLGYLSPVVYEQEMC